MAILREEYHYKYPFIHWVFFLAALGLFVTAGWMVWDDYDRQWKTFQREAQDKLLEKRREELEQKRKEIRASIEDLQAELKQQRKKLTEALSEDTTISSLAQEIQSLKQKKDRAQKIYDQSKSVAREISWKMLNYRRLHGQENETLKQKLEEQKETIQENLNKVNELDQELQEKQDVLESVRSIQRKINSKQKQLNAQQNEVARLTKKWRNAPILNYASPTIEPKQIVLNHFKDDYNYTKVRKVDRCQTCHFFIDKPGYEGLENPYKTHPKLDLYLGANSPHPVKEYGCTICHKGRGRSLHFARAAHSSTSEETLDEWKKEYDWHEQEHWHKPMTPQKYIEASCFKCHSQQETVPFAEELNRGENLVRRKGCYGCHTIKTLNDLPNPGPSLRHVQAKVDKKWMYRWIRRPSSFKHSRMPDFYDLTNDQNKKFQNYNTVEIRAITEFLWAQSKSPTDWEEIPADLTADAEEGKVLFEQRGCEACHTVNKPVSWANKESNWTRGFGFDLGGVSIKVKSMTWLYNWIRDPNRYDAHSRMPDLNLSPQESLNIAKYLKENSRFQKIRNKEDFEKEIPERKEVQTKGLDELIMKQLSVSHPSYVANRLLEALGSDDITSETRSFVEKRDKSVLKALNKQDDPYSRKLYWLGEKMIRFRGCAGCHEINGLEDAGKVGAELTGSNSVGNKPLFMFAFGNLSEKALPKDSELKNELEEKGWLLPETRWAWFEQKLEHPRSFDYEQPDLSYRAKLKMPKFEFTEEEISSITTFLMGLTNREIPHEYTDTPEGEEIAVEKGKRIAREKNCIGCHNVGTQLQDITAYKSQEYFRRTFMKKIQDRSDAWLGGYLLHNPSNDNSFFRLEVSEQDRKTLKSRGVEVVAEKGDYINPDLLRTIRDLKFERIPVYAWNEGTIHKRISASGAHPPDLKLVGKRLQSKWLFDFLKNPWENRWRRELAIRMPDFGLTDQEVLTLSKFFYNRNDEPYPYKSREELKITEEERQIAIERVRECYTQCHKIASNSTPAPLVDGVSERTKPQFLDEMGWLPSKKEQEQGLGPSVLEPGTAMAMTVELTEKQKEAVIKYLYNLTEEQYEKEIQRPDQD